MPPARWAILTIEQTLTATGYIIVITTNTPCHLYMRWTTEKPGIHHVPVLQRGIFMHTDIRLCFVAYHDNEQEEAGDTTTHTFTKEPWAVCETRWFYFHGAINGIASPSTSPIFEKHRVYAPPPPTPHTFYPDPSPEVTSVDGVTYRHQATGTWASVRDNPGTYGNHTLNLMTISIWCAWNTNTWRRMYRSFLLFDTSAIGAAATITAATLRFIPYYKTFIPLWENSDYCIVPATPLSDTEIVITDHQNLGSVLLSDTLPKIKDIVLNDWLEFPLNATGLDAINKTGISKFAVRNNCYDRMNVQPPWKQWKAHGFNFWASEKGNGFKPELIVTY